MNMTIALKIFLEEIGDNEFSQIHLAKKVYEITNGKYTLESIYGNVFRNKKNYPWFLLNYTKRKIKNRVYWKKSITTYNQSFEKPKEYFESLQILNLSENIYTLCGTESNCCKVLDKEKTIKVDFLNKVTEPDIRGDIFKIKKKDNSSFNLDFEGIFSKKKANDINNLKAERILLTFKSSKNDIYIKDLKYKKTFIKEYKSNGHLMKIYLLEDLFISSKSV